MQFLCLAEGWPTSMAQVKIEKWTCKSTALWFRTHTFCFIFALADLNAWRYQSGWVSAPLFSFQRSHSTSFPLFPSSIIMNQSPAHLIHLDIFHLYHFQFKNNLALYWVQFSLSASPLFCFECQISRGTQTLPHNDVNQKTSAVDNLHIRRKTTVKKDAFLRVDLNYEKKTGSKHIFSGHCRKNKFEPPHLVQEAF